MADAHKHNHILPRLDNSAYSRESERPYFVLALTWLVLCCQVDRGLSHRQHQPDSDGYHSLPTAPLIS